jgi:phosphomethylpyrimidine synthase
MTQLEAAKRGIVTPEMEYVAKVEGLDPRVEIVIPANKIHLSKNLRKLTGIGKGLRTKVNANLGTSFDYVNVEEEKQKLLVAVEAGADTVMDLSTGGDFRWGYAKFLWVAFRYTRRNLTPRKQKVQSLTLNRMTS